jgi:nucleoside-diphosphate-sugar epimerase
VEISGNSKSIQHVKSEVDILFRQAAMVSVSQLVKNSKGTRDVNVTRTVNVLGGTREGDVPRPWVVIIEPAILHGDSRATKTTADFISIICAAWFPSFTQV